MVNQQAYPYILSSLFACMCNICICICVLANRYGHVTEVDIRMFSVIASGSQFLRQDLFTEPGYRESPRESGPVGSCSSDYSLCGSYRSKLRTLGQDLSISLFLHRGTGNLGGGQAVRSGVWEVRNPEAVRTVFIFPLKIRGAEGKGSKCEWVKGFGGLGGGVPKTMKAGALPGRKTPLSRRSSSNKYLKSLRMESQSMYPRKCFSFISIYFLNKLTLNHLI